MSDTDVNVPKSLQSSPKQQQPGPREKVVMDTLLKELKTLHTQLEEAIQGVACEVVQTMYNPAVSALNIDGTWTEIMADLPENLYGLVAIAVFNMLAGNILRAREQDLMLRALVTAWDIMKASKFIHSGHPKTEATTKSVLVLGILVLRIPSLAQTLGFSLTGPADGSWMAYWQFHFGQAASVDRVCAFLSDLDNLVKVALDDPLVRRQDSISACTSGSSDVPIPPSSTGV